MYATALIVFREILEAGLIIGIVLAATQGIPRRGHWVLGGLVAGLLGALLTASLAEQLMAAMDGMGQELFNASILMVAVIMLGWHSIWMQKHGRELAGKLRRYGNAVSEGDSDISVLAIVIGLAVLREGAEVVLFLHGIAASGSDSAMAMLFGGMLGVGGGVIVGLLIYFGLLRIPSRYLFQITTVLILLLAAGMAAQAAHYLEMANILPSLGGAVWNTSWLIADNSLTGKILHTLIGYTARPDLVQLLAYGITLLLISVLMRLVNRQPGQRAIPGAAVVITVSLLGVLTMGISQNAHASHKIYSPHVEKGEFELEFRGHVNQDSDDSIDNERKDIYEVGYGITDWWFSSLFLEYEKEEGLTYQHTATAWENIFQLTDPGKYWLDAGFYVEYEVPAESNKPEKLELKLLLEKQVNRWVNTLNLTAESEVGGGASDEIEYGYAWRTKYRYKPTFEPAIEFYGDLGTDDNFGFHGDQNHQAGPVILGEFRLNEKNKLAYEIGYLFGLSDDSPDGSLKFLIELESRF